MTGSTRHSSASPDAAAAEPSPEDASNEPFRPLGDGRFLDSATGLVVTQAPTGALHRVFQTQYTALNPPIPSGSQESWSRWDVLDHVTLYGAERAEAAVVETLAYAKPAKLPLDEIFPDVQPGEDPVAQEWEALGHMGRGQIARAWRAARQLTRIRLRSYADSWCIDVSHSQTIAALRAAVGAWAPDAALQHDPARVDMSLLAGGQRFVTTEIARWLRNRVLADGSEPSGIRFHSRHGTDLVCWAIWVPLLGETDQAQVPALVAKVATADPPIELTENLPALLTASRLLGVRVH